MMVGDSVVDLETARGAGCRMCVARYGFGTVPASAVTTDTVEALRSEELLRTLTAVAGV
jgi:phosphoglycolate phosphatase-like HAD superfamily hydrolase